MSNYPHLVNWLRRLFAAEGGSIVVMAAFALTAVMGMAGLAVELGNGYATKVRNQRVADMAALGAALAYQSSSQSTSAATQVAKDIVVANGLPSSAATVAFTQVSGIDAVQVKVTTSVPIKMASLITSAASYDVTNSAAASLSAAGGAGCVTALSSSKPAIDMGGGAKLSAGGCAVVTNGTLSLSGGAQVTTKQVVASETSVGGGASITTTPSTNNIVTKSNGASDTIKNQSAVMTALCYVNKLNSTSDSDYVDGNTNCASQLKSPDTVNPTGAADWDMTSKKPSANVAAYWNGSSYVVPAGPTYNIGNLTIDGNVTFTGPTTIIADSITLNGGASLTIGDGVVKVAGAVKLAGGATVTIGNGDHSFGSISIGGGSKFYTGTGNLNVTYDINVDGGGSEAKFAPSTGNTVVIGANKGIAISISGGSTVSFDRYGTSVATGGTQSAGPVGFSAGGSIKSSGGSMVVFNKAAVHVIKGDLDLNGSSVMGSGLYVIGGNLSNNTGGTMTGTDVSFALGGSFTLAGGTSLDLAASSTSSGYGIQDILVVTKSSSTVSIGGGSSDKYSGVFYAPKAEIKLTGGAALSNNGSKCLMLIVNSVTMAGGADFGTNSCASQINNPGTTVALIQ